MDAFLDKQASLTPMARGVMCNNETEAPFSGAYNEVVTQGSYLCKRCGLALFRGHSQFSAGCGWPSFDDIIPNAVTLMPDSDGLRTEIRCGRCEGHLGHVFTGEHFTQKNTRYCVNSLAIDFVNSDTVLDTEEAILAGGCFWGVEYYLSRLPGVLNVEVGYTGGTVEHPTYEDICKGSTGHYEAVRVLFDVKKTTYTNVLKRFFEIHDPTQSGGQGPDLGHQYQSAVFYYDDEQKMQLQLLLKTLRDNGYGVVTRAFLVNPFWPAEDYHQHYYSKLDKKPYCHQPVMRFAQFKQ